MKHMKNFPSLLYSYHELKKICGKHQRSYDLSKLGKNIRVWMWDTSKLVPQRYRTAVLALADKAKELDLEVYLFNVLNRGNRRNEIFQEVQPDGNLETVNRVVVWCPYE